MSPPKVGECDLTEQSDQDLMEMYAREKVRAKYAEENLSLLLVEMKRRGGLKTEKGFFTESYRVVPRMNLEAVRETILRLGGTEEDYAGCKRPNREGAGWRYAKSE